MVNSVTDCIVLSVGIYSCLYIIAAVIIASGEYRFQRNNPPKTLPFVTIIVCARNEENTIRRCIGSLLELDYPHDKLEIVLVDDESEDTTGEIIRSYTENHPNISFLSTAGETNDFPGKQRPLDCGIRNSAGDIILTTDADCAAYPDWVLKHVAAYRDTTGIVGGITGISTESGNAMDHLQNCDQVSKLAVAMGCAGTGLPLTVMGNNMSFKREAYEACGGFEKIGPSLVEDVDLMYSIVRHTNYRLGWIHSIKPLVLSTPSENFTLLVGQRQRMLHISGKIPLIGKMLLGMESVMLWHFILALLVIFNEPAAFCLIAPAWITGWYIVVFPVSGKKMRDFVLIPGMLVFQITYGIALSYRLLTGGKRIFWKGRYY